jgi:F0F1-type ATP synthase beta subunit
MPADRCWLQSVTPFLGGMFDVFGNAIDCEPVPSGLQWRSVHQTPPPLATRSTKWDVFETGIKINSLQESGISKPGTSPLDHSGQIGKHEA